MKTKNIFFGLMLSLVVQVGCLGAMKNGDIEMAENSGVSKGGSVSLLNHPAEKAVAYVFFTQGLAPCKETTQKFVRVAYTLCTEVSAFLVDLRLPDLDLKREKIPEHLRRIDEFRKRVAVAMKLHTEIKKNSPKELFAGLSKSLQEFFCWVDDELKNKHTLLLKLDWLNDWSWTAGTGKSTPEICKLMLGKDAENLPQAKAPVASMGKLDLDNDTLKWL